MTQAFSRFGTLSDANEGAKTLWRRFSFGAATIDSVCLCRKERKFATENSINILAD